MRVAAVSIVAGTLLIAGCGAGPAPDPSPERTSGPTADTSTLVIAPGRIGPVRSGMTLADAKKTGLVEEVPAQADDPCPPPALRWKSPNTDKLTLLTDQGTVSRIGARDAGFQTAEGIGVGSTWADIKEVYPDAQLEASDALGSVVYRKDRDRWLGMAFNETTNEINNDAQVIYVEVARGERPTVYLSGC